MFFKANHDFEHAISVLKSVLRMIIVAIIVFMISNIAFFQNTYGASVAQGVVKIKSGNVRKEASTSSQIAFCVKSDETVAILGEEKAKDGSAWFKIAVGNSVGYIRADLVSKTDKKINVSDSLVSENKAQESLTSSNNKNEKKEEKKEEAKQEDKKNDSSTDNSNVGVIKGTFVRIRKGASTSTGVDGYLDLGTKVTILNEGKGDDGQAWYQIKYNDKVGFVRSDFVDKEEKKENKEEVLLVEEKEELLEENTLIEGEKKEEKEDSDAEKENGFDKSKYEAGEGTVKGTDVRVRSEANTTSEIITKVNSGTKFRIWEVIKNDDMNWYRIEILDDSKTTEGFICANFVELTKEVKEIEVPNEDDISEEADDGGSVIEEAEEVLDEASDDSELNKHGSIKGAGVRIRQTPVTGNVICQLSNGHPLTIDSLESGDDGFGWYAVSFSYLGSPKTGYVRQDFVIKADEEEVIAPKGDEEFEELIAPLPDSYKNSIRKLHADHENWKFEIVDTGLDWNDALKAESSVGKNLVSKNSIASWKSTAAQAYNWSKNIWYTFDGGSWASASPELIAYYMDPRNFLNESGIYQFECLDYKDTQNKESVSKMLAGTFMSGDFTDTDGTATSYADVFMTAGQMQSVSPYLLAGRCLQEQGVFGKSKSISGKVKKHEGFFNFYNIGAYAYGGRSATINGLIYAAGSDEDNMRPWNTRIRSIYGGAKYISEKYVSKGQNTLYFQKFNVVNAENNYYSHQYMSNIQAASSESARLQLAYIGSDEELVFRIPYYQNMPEVKCEKPVSDSSPNTYLSSLSVDGFELIPAFTGGTEKYLVKVDSSVENVAINAQPVSGSSSVAGVGTYPVSKGMNTFYIACKAQNGAVKTYTITVQKQ